jgi:hypothetical protein
LKRIEPKPPRWRRIANLEEEIDRLQRAEKAISWPPARHASVDAPPWVVPVHRRVKSR